MFAFKNIKIARDSRMLSQSDLAKKIGLSQALLSKIEKGLIVPNEQQQEVIATGLGYPMSFFSEEISLLQNDSIFYRKRQSLKVKDLSFLEGKIAILGHCVDVLQDSVEIPECNIPHCEVDQNNTADEIAFKIRNYLAVPSGPIINMVSLLERNGILVIPLSGLETDKFDAVSTFTAQGIPTIWLNADMPNDRKRSTLAHELGHFVMHLRSGDLQKSEDEKEEEAKLFAAEFLLPRSLCQEDLFNLKYRDLNLKKMYWKVSKAFLIKRAAQLHCISAQTEKYLYITLGRQGERKMETCPVELDDPIALKKMVNLHLNELEYTIDELSDIIGLRPTDIRKDLQNQNAHRNKILLFKQTPKNYE